MISGWYNACMRKYVRLFGATCFVSGNKFIGNQHILTDVLTINQR